MYAWVLGDWRTIGYVAISAALIYGSVVLGLRIGERRTLAEMTAYDFAVAVAIGTIVGRTATTSSPSYAQGVTAMAALLVMHNALSWMRMRWPRWRHYLEHGPVVLVTDGVVDHAALTSVRVTRDDLDTALREHGVADVGDAALVTLESRGAFSVIPSRRPTG